MKSRHSETAPPSSSFNRQAGADSLFNKDRPAHHGSPSTHRKPAGIIKTVQVNKVPRDPGPAAWNQIIGPARPYPELEHNITADYLIVGGGMTGLAAAKRLTQLAPGARIVLLEARRLAQGPAGRNSGFMIDLPHDLNSKTYAGGRDQDIRQIRFNRTAIQYVRDIAAELDMPKQVFDACGKYTGAASARGQKHIASYIKHLDALGEEYRLLDQKEMKRLTGTDYYLGGLYTAGAAMIQPAAYVRRLAEDLLPSVSIYENSPVVEMVTTDNAVTIVKTPRGGVTAPKVILAVNGHVQSFGYFKRTLMHVFTYASMTRALTSAECQQLGGEKDWGLLPADPMGTTVRRTSEYSGSGDRITIRNHFTLNQSMEVSEKRLWSFSKYHDQSFKARFPMLDGVPMEYRWGGRLCLTLNSVPAFGEVEPGVISAACQNGLGTVKGTMSGLMAAELATGQKSPMLDAFMAYDKPSLLPPEPFLSLGANATMQFKEWLAGVEL
ncbi:NAD(P)/FAD-dependent oxidoreductase [Hahella ganghwensis]|uniref:NAD(P)/FAD-dependent oxidoreductase n=1 Tax=Hahella ganghwensis TaxID=286420 RepID=UPI000372D304|nr:FAD-binding oxidoreductase [Hahella ganghwensis]